ncbi:MAG TPA: hypothetical protein K8U88_01310 [Levilactobacillus hammesii]|uniref:Uncharacterized protein n=1 Tax=Levilactobacillus hammesii TaxID=267633 RepID=A0A921JVK7_9LACO|nr:hypothetical protein [Levilactobacillus hammesii]
MKKDISLLVLVTLLGISTSTVFAKADDTDSDSSETEQSVTESASTTTIDTNTLSLTTLNDGQPAVFTPSELNTSQVVLGGSGLTWHLQSTKKFNNLSTKQFLVQLGGEWQHYNYSTIGSESVKKGLSGKHWYTVKRYTAKNAGHAYVKVVAKVYSNSSRTHLITTLEEEWRA